MDNMIKVTVFNNVGKEQDIVADSKTLREVLDAHNVDYTVTSPTLDGSKLEAGDLDKTFKDYNITSSCYLGAIVKTDNANIR